MERIALLKKKKKRYKHRKFPLGIYKSKGGFQVKAWDEEGNISHLGTFKSLRRATYERLVWTQGHHWHLNDLEIPRDSFGFIYCVTNLKNNRMYIGSKQFYYWNGPVGGYKCTDPSDEWWDHRAWRSGMWEKYITSSDELKLEILKGDIWDYKFEILELCPDKLTLHLAEIKHMMKRDVLEATNSMGQWLYYNKNIAGKIFRPPFSLVDAKEMIRKSKDDMRNYYLLPNHCPTCGDMIPYGKTGCIACSAAILEVGFG